MAMYTLQCFGFNIKIAMTGSVITIAQTMATKLLNMEVFIFSWMFVSLILFVLLNACRSNAIT